MTVHLRGVTWQHERGLSPVLATAAAYQALHPAVRVQWEARPLMAFGERPVAVLADHYDLVVLDHPWVGFMASSGCYLPLDELLPAEFLREQAEASVGASHRSYEWGGHQWALAIDAAAMAASYRPDLLEEMGAETPRTWDDVLALAEQVTRYGRSIAMPLNHIDSISVFLTVVNNMGGEPYRGDEVAGRDVGAAALRLLRAVAQRCPSTAFDDTPVTVMDRMGSGDDIVYCPLAYTYSNYSRPGYRDRVCRYTDMPVTRDGPPTGSHLGGAGLAISAQCRHPALAADYARMTASPEWQRTIYYESGGQPGHGSAWHDEALNHTSGGFFRGTWRTMAGSYLRPRYNGYIACQHECGHLVRDYLRDGGDEGAVLDAMDAAYERSRRTASGVPA